MSSCLLEVDEIMSIKCLELLKCKLHLPFLAILRLFHKQWSLANIHCTQGTLVELEHFLEERMVFCLRGLGKSSRLWSLSGTTVNYHREMIISPVRGSAVK